MVVSIFISCIQYFFCTINTSNRKEKVDNDLFYQYILRYFYIHFLQLKHNAMRNVKYR